ncbi:MAG TPA: transglutaminase domain-containing protein [Myxococcaceae bacterium]|nr:transglutaminase domain-containing protein [Myxococcaceae bacterium]
MPLATRRFTLALALAAAAGCAALPRPRPNLTPHPVLDASALEAAAEAFYSGGDAAALRDAAEAADRAAPGSGLAHELAAQLARLEMRDSDEVEHLLAACADPSHDATAQHLLRLNELDRSEAQHARYLGLMEALVASHPDPDVRATAAALLASHLHTLGDDKGRDAAVRALGPALPFQVVGGWDNDQGKGFDAPWPPEQGVDLSARYDGALMEIGWQAPPRDLIGAAMLTEFVAPDRWSVAYAAAGVAVPRDGTYEVRLASTDPVKLWVNGELVFEAREVESSWAVDQFVVPVALRAGENQLLVKSAHRTGSWRLYARVTGEGGASVEARPAAAGPYRGPPLAQKPRTEEQALDAHLHGMKPGARRSFYRSAWTADLFGGNPAVRVAQEYARSHPDAALAQLGLVAALWNANERGRTADELTALDRRVGDSLPLVRRQLARFWQQEGLRSRARKTLVELTQAYPDRVPAVRQLASLFRAERWIEDECSALERFRARRAPTFEVDLDVADCWSDEGREDRAIELVRQLLQRRPRHPDALRDLEELLRERGRLGEAAQAARKILEAYPDRLWPRLRLADDLRRAGDAAGAEAVLSSARTLFPNSAEVYRAQASLAWRRGDQKKAIDEWQAALVRSPDDDATANRLDFVAPTAAGAWAGDVPDEEAIARAVEGRKRLEPAPGADLAYLLDHEVTELRPDGSTINVVTTVVTALNQAGRDKLTRRKLDYSGRVRVLHAYSLDAQGHRSEASVRSREVLYRGLDVGSTIVLQYRADAPPSGFLPRYLTRLWFFQAVNDQRVRAEFILWYPSGTTLNETRLGGLQREERKAGDQVRVSWQLDGGAPVVAEPNMPGVLEAAANVQLSTIPGWDAYERWEEALLEGAFRDSPELDALAARLVDGASTPEEKLYRIHAYVMEEIRYEQDYESFIAGVKPHPASMVVERRYGDCKDKTVLFIALARKAGIEAQFATVRTRDRGQVRKELPSQQFNHAIVYVPPQPGFSEGRFFDSTADALDLDVLRDDDAGTEALVYDAKSRRHTWVPIPWQSTAHHQTRSEFKLALAQDGSAEGELTLRGRGRFGSLLRRVSRNPEVFKQFVQMVAGAQFAGSSLSESSPVQVTDLRRPAEVRARFSAPTVARREGNTLRIRLPADGGLKQSFSLARRRYPLVLGTPNEQHWRFEIALPEGMRAARLPSSGEVSTQCLSLKRRVSANGSGVAVEQSLISRCERISPEEYPAYRAQLEQMTRLLDEDLVLQPAPASPLPRGRALGAR